MINLLGIFIGGGIGSILRSLVCGRFCSHWGVMLVNVIGAFVIGFAYHFFSTRTELRPEWRAFIITGLLGGFTTFSTYMLDFGNLLNSQRLTEAMLYLLGSIIVGVVFLFLGIALGKLIV